MSLYLKYRPKDFENLMGQSFIKDTLKAAIAQNKTVGAYLLCGPRGTGKTTTARLLAKTINCLNPKDGNPCLECSVCVDFNNERLIDIIEIDAASHTGVDNIRDIIERAQFSPTKTKYKIYIIDEVHMLSKGAFNALLKILEEPPSHVKFILATTETHKVPETIISRCQRYDFKRINNEDIKNRLKYISEQENISVDEESYDYIVSHSAGGLRNAISLYEQLIIDSKISFSLVKEKMGIIGADEIDNILNKLLTKDTSVINDLDKIINDGKNLKLFIRDLIFFIKNKTLGKIRLGENINDYIYVLDTLDSAYSKSKGALDENITLMIGVLKIIGNYSENTIASTKTNTIKPIQNISINEINKEEEKQELKKETIKNNEEKSEVLNNDLTSTDINDIFGDFSDNKDIEVKDIKSNDVDFNSNKFISKLKDSGAKGSLTMALRGSKICINDNCIIISGSTSITKKTIENVDNQAFMINILNQMGFENISIRIN